MLTVGFKHKRLKIKLNKNYGKGEGYGKITLSGTRKPENDNRQGKGYILIPLQEMGMKKAQI